MGPLKVTSPKTLNVLPQRIIQRCLFLTLEVFCNARRALQAGIYYCFEANGWHIESFLQRNLFFNHFNNLNRLIKFVVKHKFLDESD